MKSIMGYIAENRVWEGDYILFQLILWYYRSFLKVRFNRTMLVQFEKKKTFFGIYFKNIQNIFLLPLLLSEQEKK